MDTDSSNICIDGWSLVFPYVPVVFKIFDGLNFNWLTGKYQILHYTVANLINTAIKKSYKATPKKSAISHPDVLKI